MLISFDFSYIFYLLFCFLLLSFMENDVIFCMMRVFAENSGYPSLTCIGLKMLLFGLFLG